MMESLFPKEIQVNIVLEETTTNRLHRQTVRMVGFVIINNPNIKLSNLRLKVLSELDEQQLQIIGLNFKFLKGTFPVSFKQEQSMTLTQIGINLSNSNLRTLSDVSVNVNDTAFMLQPPSPIQNNRNQSIVFTKETCRAFSAQNTNTNSLLIVNENDEKISPIKTNSSNNLNTNTNALPSYNILPHHYQYMSSHLGITSPMVQQQHSVNVANTNTSTNNLENECTFPKITICTTPSTPNSQIQPHCIFAQDISKSSLQNETNETESTYTVMVRSCHSVVHKSMSDDVTLHSLFINTSFGSKSNGGKNAFGSKSSNSSNKNDGNPSQPLSPIIINTSMQKFKHKKKKERMEQSFASFRASFLSSYAITSPKSTRLETQLGEKLPRIRPKTCTQSQFLAPSNEVDCILKKAMLSRKNTCTVREEHAYEEEVHAEELEHAEEVSTSISINVSQVNNGNMHPNCSIVPLKAEFNYLIDEDVKCKFTVIGSPMINDHDNNNNMNNSENNINNNNNNQANNIVWEFGNESDLIKGLSGIHHNAGNPLWIDLVCDGNTFINIAEHIRPSIHNLTIEDCLTIDCREKLEIFKHYLFICLRVSSTTAADEHLINQKINILIFKTMIITYHLGDSITLGMVENVSKILNKKFANICPSPAWICHTIIDNVIDKMMPQVESTVREVETCEQFVFKLCNQSQNELLHRMQIARAWMVLYRSRLWSKSTITHNLLNNLWRKDFLPDVPQAYWRDVHDHVARMVDLLELGTQTLESIQNIFVAKVSLEMTQQSNNLAKVGGKLAGVGAVFLPLTVITGIWGMNCKVPFQYNPDLETTNNMYGFIIVLFIMFFISIITWIFVNQKGGWINQMN